MRPELQFFAFPLSLILAAALFVSILLFPKKCPRRLSVVVLSLLAIGFAVIGCLKPSPVHSYFLAPLILACIFFSGVEARDAIRNKAGLNIILSHLGLGIVLASSLFSAPDSIQSAIILDKDQPKHLCEDGMVLDFDLELKEVHTEYYEGTDKPRQYRSTILLNGKARQISINHPASYKGWLLYLSDFDRQHEKRAMLKIVRDPSIPGVLLGMVMLVIAAVLGVKRSWKSRLALPAVIAIALIFTLISVSRINFSTLPPALRSFWFAPHLMVYMLAYSTLALSLICAIAGFIPRASKAAALSRPLLETSSSLILMGIVFGAIWAQLSWGDYWAWDAKECWASATYLLTLCAVHLPRRNNNAIFAASLLLSFAAMQMTWYGVNLLPSARSSMHTYNSK